MVISIKPELRYENSILIINDGVEFKYSNIECINLKLSNKIIKKLNFDKNMYWNNLKKQIPIKTGLG